MSEVTTINTSYPYNTWHFSPYRPIMGLGFTMTKISSSMQLMQNFIKIIQSTNVEDRWRNRHTQIANRFAEPVFWYKHAYFGMAPLWWVGEAFKGLFTA
jgi:hypothetical protein